MWPERGQEMKKHVIIGTAGHVDHGKTCLVKALTGTDTDRLKEEKQRGITIDLGFASMPLPGGGTAGIVDVPGHEKFIRNMLAGAGGIRLVLLAVAADEGIMPQTVEHLEILSLLGIEKGLLAVTKTDTVEPGQCLKVKKELEKLTEGTFLEGAPVVFTSVKDGTGIRELRETLCRLAEEVSLPDTEAPFRLPIDRVFTLKGFGTIATGTLIEGTLSVKDEAMLYPGEETIKLRTIQVHGQEAERAFAGQRVAVNLPGKKKEELSRGDVLAAPGSMEKAFFVSVSLKVCASSGRSVKNGSRVHLYHGTEELLCRIRLQDKKVLRPGEEGQALLALEKEAAMKSGDRFIIRYYSPVETIGGGRVQEINPPKRRREKRGSVSPVQEGALLTKTPLQETSLYKELEALYRSRGFLPPLTAEVKASYGKEPDFSAVFMHLVQKKVLIRVDEAHYVHRAGWEKAVGTAKTLWEQKGEIPTGEYRDALGISRKTAISLLEAMDKARLTRWDGKKRILNFFLAGACGKRPHIEC